MLLLLSTDIYQSKSTNNRINDLRGLIILPFFSIRKLYSVTDSDRLLFIVNYFVVKCDHKWTDQIWAASVLISFHTQCPNRANNESWACLTAKQLSVTHSLIAVSFLILDHCKLHNLKSPQPILTLSDKWLNCQHRWCVTSILLNYSLWVAN